MMSDSKWLDREKYDELYQLIHNVVCVPRKTIRIAGEDYPYSLVKSKFLKLNSTHLEHMLTGLFWAPADHIGNNVVRIIVKGVILLIMVLIEFCVLINATLPWLERKENNKPRIRVEK